MTDHVLAINADLAVVAVGRLRESWPWLGDLVEPGRARRTQHHLTDTGRALLNRLVLAERSERALLAQQGLKPSGASGAPVNVAAVDAMVTIQGILDDTAWRVTSALRLRDGMGYRQVGRTGDQRVTAALDYLAVMLPHVDDIGTVTDASIRLAAADRLARRVAGVDSDRRHLATACPACGRRSLYAEIGSPNHQEWAVLCGRDDCRCRGIDCACRRPGRCYGTPHLWPEKEWTQLAAVLTRRDAA